MDKNSAIGIFDSGVGGVSVLRDLVRLMPDEQFLYYGDDRNAPYGTRPKEEIRRLATGVVELLLGRGIKALVIACNTASGAAAATLRAELTIPVIAMEPALKPAEEGRRGGQILVMATPLTLKQEKFLGLMDRFGAHALPMPCPGLMELVEREDEAGARRYLEKIFGTWELENVDAVVLGCTHYVFLKPMIRQMLPDRIRITDGNAGTARQLRRVLAERGLLREERAGSVRMETSGEAEKILPVMERLYEKALLIS